MNDFFYYNPTKIHFGKNSLASLQDELTLYGPNILLAYGSSSIHELGLYKEVKKILALAGKTVFDFPNIMPNPTVEKAIEGAKIAKDMNIDFILAVGGGSVIDCAKAISVFANADDLAFEKYYFRQEAITHNTIPLGVILTMVGSGSEMNGGSVLTSQKYGYKVGRIFGADVHPKFSILNPEYTYSVSYHHMIAGIFDAMSHLMEQYFSDTEDFTSDYLTEGLLKSLIDNARVAINNPKSYVARSNIMWAASLAACGLVGSGKKEDWQVHMIAHTIGSLTDCTHGMALAAVSLPYYCSIYKYGLAKFVRFAVNVWSVNKENKTDDEIALAGLDSMLSFMKEIGLDVSLKDLGVTKEMLIPISEKTFILDSGYKKLTKQELLEILKQSFEKNEVWHV